MYSLTLELKFINSEKLKCENNIVIRKKKRKVISTSYVCTNLSNLAKIKKCFAAARNLNLTN